jgi:uncharacterized protein YceH (UPF0502 family)
MEREDGPFIARLPRAAGARESRYAHLFSGAIESAPEVAEPVDAGLARTGASVAERLAQLENQVADLRTEIDALKAAAATAQ